MKSFLFIEKFKELKALFILEIITSLLLAVLIKRNDLDINYWNWKAFAVSRDLSFPLDNERCWSLATLIGTGPFVYLLWWFIFNLQLS